MLAVTVPGNKDDRVGVYHKRRLRNIAKTSKSLVEVPPGDGNDLNQPILISFGNDPADVPSRLTKRSNVSATSCCVIISSTTFF